MQKQIKYWCLNFIGGSLVIIGIIFIVLPGPAFLFLPIGLAILSLEYIPVTIQDAGFSGN